AALRFPSTNNKLRTSSNLRNQATIQDDRVHVQQVQGRQGQSYAGTGNKGNATSSEGNNARGQERVVKCYNCQGEGHIASVSQSSVISIQHVVIPVIDEEETLILEEGFGWGIDYYIWCVCFEELDAYFTVGSLAKVNSICDIENGDSKKRRLVTELEAVGEVEGAVKCLEHMRVIVARDADTLEELETLFGRGQVGVSLKAGFVTDMGKNPRED
ncbi:retrovirus-related pol polyprotein from transposon TNT 1-94, partial [Tanacetum coccineum]